MFFSLSSTTSTRSPAIDCRRPLTGKGEDEPAAVSRLALHPDPPAVQLDQTLGERQPEARALVLFDPDGRLLEFLEDPLAIDCRDPRPGIGDRHDYLAVRTLRGNDDAAAFGRELDRVRE